LYVSSIQAQTYIRDYTYKASEADSKITSRAIAVDQVKAILLQEIGTHIRQKINITKDGKGNTYANEDVEAITAWLTKVDILEEKWNEETYFLKAKIEADTQRVLNALEEFKKERSDEIHQQIESLRINEKLLKKSRKEIARLTNKLKTEKLKSKKEKIVVKYISEVNKLSAGEMVNNGTDLLWYQQKQYKNSANLFKKAAELESSIAQFNIAQMYNTGRGIEQSFQMAFYWYHKAANKGIVYAQNNLGMKYKNGEGVNRNPGKAIYWFRKAADKGNVLAMANLAVMYRLGEGVTQDFGKAIFWYKKAAITGHASSQFNLGAMYYNGDGVKKNLVKGKKLFRKSCNNGYKQACQYM